VSRRIRVDWRHRGGRKPDDVVSVARPSKWGNPYSVSEYGRERAVQLYREYLKVSPDLVDAARRELAGKRLACYCQLDELCHADVLLVAIGERGMDGWHE